MTVRRTVWLGIALAAACSIATSCAAPVGEHDYHALVRRTPGGIPHIRANDFGSLAFGSLYAMAEDNVCILADQYTTLGARRSRHLGPDGGNLESDFFYQLFIDRAGAEEPLPADADALFSGAAAGFNHYLRETGVDALPDAACRGASWVETIEPLDARRVSHTDYALGYMQPMIVAAAPPRADGDTGDTAAPAPELIAAAVEAYLELPREGGSNAVAIGSDASASGRGMLLGNPHMPWNEPFQRFYPMHQTIPGTLDAIGATLIGRVTVGVAHTESIAWTSTVSTAKRVSFYRLELVPGDPTRYLFDGVARPMKQERVTVTVKSETGELEERSHTFYSTHFGALLVESDFFRWTPEQAFAVRIPSAGWRGMAANLETYRARSVRELKAIHDRAQFLPVNLIAADRNGEVLFSDPGAVPNLSDEQLEDCAVLQGAAYDGSRSACMWRNDEDAAAPGIIGPSRLPELYRRDYVTNSNGSYWLSNPAAPLTGFARILGPEETPATLRTRSGLSMVRRVLDARGKMSLEDLQGLTLANENQAGQLLRDDLVALCRAQPTFTLEDGSEIDLTAACSALEAWDLHANLDSRGAHVLRELLSEANGQRHTRQLPESFVPRIPFDSSNPVDTPSGLDPASYPAALASLAKAVARLEEAGIPHDAPLGELQGVTRNGQRIPLHGGPEYEGVFNKIEAAFAGSEGYPDVTRSSSSWILAMEFTEDGPRARGILTYSLSANPESPHYDDQTWMYSRKEWLDLPFREADVALATERSYEVSAPRSD